MRILLEIVNILGNPSKFAKKTGFFRAGRCLLDFYQLNAKRQRDVIRTRIKRSLWVARSKRGHKQVIRTQVHCAYPRKRARKRKIKDLVREID